MPLSISINISLPTIYMYVRVHVHVYLYVCNMSMYPCLMMFCLSVAQFPKFHMYMYCMYVRVQLYVELVQCRVNVEAVGYISRLCHEQYTCIATLYINVAYIYM